ncbi:MAG: biopolymer transporter ExbD [Pseudomonadota bacterium]
MAIKVPGIRARRGRVQPQKRSAVAVLQLTAMVDMFTVLVVFLLQNYATTDQILPMPEAVELPQAQSVKELAPSNVVVITEETVLVNEDKVASFSMVKESKDWLIVEVEKAVKKLIEEGEEEKLRLGNQIQKAVSEARDGEAPEDLVDEFRKITIQADSKIDFLTVKKIMYTVTEAGIYEINFAVVKKPEEIDL